MRRQPPTSPVRELPQRGLRQSGAAALILAVLVVVPDSSRACQPEPNFLFRGEARLALDSLSDSTSAKGAFTRIVLMHNLGFHKDKVMRERAEKLLEKRFPDKSRTPLMKAYEGSLQMIKVSHRPVGAQVFRTANPFTKSPREEARQGFRMISDAEKADSANVIIRTLRATAAAESADHLPELFDVAAQELTWLESKASAEDSVQLFMLNLNWAKYQYKRTKTQSVTGAIDLAADRVSRARAYACTPVYAGWAAEWEKRIADLKEQLETITEGKD